MRSSLSGQQRARNGAADRPAPDEADPLHLPRVQRHGRPRPAQHARVGDADRGMASRIEIATDAVDLVVTDYDVLTAPAHKRASMDAEYRTRGRPPEVAPPLACSLTTPPRRRTINRSSSPSSTSDPTPGHGR